MRIENTSLSQPLQPMVLAINSGYPVMRRGLGFVDPVSATALTELFGSSGANFIGGLFGVKSPEQTAYDTGREAIWQNFQNLTRQKDSVISAAANSGTLTQADYAPFIADGDRLIRELETLTQTSTAPSDWVTPRFYDFYNPMKTTVANWRNEQAQAPGGGLVSQLSQMLPTQIAGFDPMTLLLVGGAAYLLFRK